MATSNKAKGEGRDAAPLRAIEEYESRAIRFSIEGEYLKAARQMEYAGITARVNFRPMEENELARKEEKYLARSRECRDATDTNIDEASRMERLIALAPKIGARMAIDEMAKMAVRYRTMAAFGLAEAGDYGNAAMQMEAARKTAKDNNLPKEERESALMEVAYMEIKGMACEGGAERRVYAAGYMEKAREISREYHTGNSCAVAAVLSGYKDADMRGLISKEGHGGVARKLGAAADAMAELGLESLASRLAEMGAECFEGNARSYLAMAARSESDRAKTRFLDGAFHEFTNAAKLVSARRPWADKKVSEEEYERLAEICMECIKEIRMGQMSHIARG